MGAGDVVLAIIFIIIFFFKKLKELQEQEQQQLLLQQQQQQKRDAELDELEAEARRQAAQRRNEAIEARRCLPLLDELDVGSNTYAYRKSQLLRTISQHRVRRLCNVSCQGGDPAFPLKLLQHAELDVEELDVRSVQRQHLLAVLVMPLLSRLSVHGRRAHQSEFIPAELPASRARLRWLRVSNLPYKTTFSLIRGCSSTLEELVLVVGTPVEGKWPEGCGGDGCDVPGSLWRCRLVELRTLVLERPAHIDDMFCRAQLKAVRAKLPRGVQVRCSSCHYEPTAF